MSRLLVLVSSVSFFLIMPMLAQAGTAVLATGEWVPIVDPPPPLSISNYSEPTAKPKSLRKLWRTEPGVLLQRAYTMDMKVATSLLVLGGMRLIWESAFHQFVGSEQNLLNPELLPGTLTIICGGGVGLANIVLNESLGFQVFRDDHPDRGNKMWQLRILSLLSVATLGPLVIGSYFYEMPMIVAGTLMKIGGYLYHYRLAAKDRLKVSRF